MLELVNIESAWPLTMSSGDVRNDIAAILYAMTSLNTRFPVLGESSYDDFLQAMANGLRRYCGIENTEADG